METGDLLIADWSELEKNNVSEVHLKKVQVPRSTSQHRSRNGLEKFPCTDGSLHHEGHLVPRPLPHRQLQTEEDVAVSDSDAHKQLLSPRKAEGDSNM